jgi:hypothetical protein
VAALVRELRESPQKVEEEPERAEEPRPDASGVQEGLRRLWWRRTSFWCMIPTYLKRGWQFSAPGKGLTMRWQVLLLTAMSITVALSLWGCRSLGGAGQGIERSEAMEGAIKLQGARELHRAIELHKAIKLPRGEPAGMGREIVPLGEEITATKIKDKTKELGDNLLEQALDNGPEAFDAYKDIDSDLDGRFDVLDNCPDVFNAHQKNSDIDGYGDACDFDVYANVDVDADSDSVKNSIDNCPYVWNWSQVNSDPAVDDYGDACDSDMDGDGYANASDTDFDIDMDGDGEWYTSDPDNDGDGVVNAYDRFDWHPAYY